MKSVVASVGAPAVVSVGMPSAIGIVLESEIAASRWRSLMVDDDDDNDMSDRSWRNRCSEVCRCSDDSTGGWLYTIRMHNKINTVAIMSLLLTIVKSEFTAVALQDFRYKISSWDGSSGKHKLKLDRHMLSTEPIMPVWGVYLRCKHDIAGK